MNEKGQVLPEIMEFQDIIEVNPPKTNDHAGVYGEEEIPIFDVQDEILREEEEGSE